LVILEGKGEVIFAVECFHGDLLFLQLVLGNRRGKRKVRMGLPLRRRKR